MVTTLAARRSLLDLGPEPLYAWLMRRLAHWLAPSKKNKNRARILHPDALFFIGGVIILLHFVMGWFLQTGRGKNILGYSSEITASSVLSQTNEQRLAQGLPPLKLNSKLSTAAQQKAEDMIAEQYWSHTSPNGKSPWSFIKKSGYSYAVAGENLGRNFLSTQNLVTAWLTSATHRQNLLSEHYTETGIAVVNAPLQGTETTLVVQMFASPKRLVAPAPSPSPIPSPLPASPPPESAPIALDTTSPPVLGEHTPLAAPYLTPLMVFRFGLSSITAFLIALLIHDVLKVKKRTTWGRSVAHLFLLAGVLATILVAQPGRLL